MVTLTLVHNVHCNGRGIDEDRWMSELFWQRGLTRTLRCQELEGLARESITVFDRHLKEREDVERLLADKVFKFNSSVCSRVREDSCTKTAQYDAGWVLRCRVRVFPCL